MIDDKPVSVRPGIPLDPIAQLERGELRPIGIVVWSGGNSDQVAVANPLRVALYIVPQFGAGQYVIGPEGCQIQPSASWLSGPLPTVVHVRDFPGMVQGAWIGSGMVGTSVYVYEYTLST